MHTSALALNFDPGQSLQNAFTTLVTYLPRLIGALLVLLIGYLICKLLRAAVRKLLHRVGVDRRLQESNAGAYVARVSPQNEPSRLVAGLVFWLLFLFVLAAAIGQLQIAALTEFMNVVLGYLPNVIAAAAILLIAAVLAAGITAAVQRTMGETPTGRVVRAAVPALIMSIAVFMVLVQLQIAAQIVILTYGALMFALALGAGLAFGLGGREVAGRILHNAYQNATSRPSVGTCRPARTGRRIPRALSADAAGQPADDKQRGSRSVGDREQPFLSRYFARVRNWPHRTA
jgi:small-conductance mechanosensitive channel